MAKHLNTVFVLDHSTDLAGPASTVFLFREVPLIPKSLWTCSVESVLEYCRIVWDLFPEDRKIKLISCDKTTHVLNSWEKKNQNLHCVKDGLSRIGLPLVEKSKNSIVYGLEEAIRSFAKLHLSTGRIIVIMSVDDAAGAKRLDNKLQQYIEYHNKKMISLIDHIDLVIINLAKNSVEFSSERTLLSTSVHSVTDLHDKILGLVREHFSLASTILTGIPMKLETKPDTSSKYNVEIYHEHQENTGTTVTLKWCQPVATELLPCVSLFRATPVDVTSNSATCLVGFLNSHSVLLGKQGKHEAKTFSHLLSARGGDIYIHALNTSSIFDEMPSISEDVGGRVTNYRIIDFGALVRKSMLIPGKIVDENLKRVRESYNKKTQYWPLTFGETVLFNVQDVLEPMLEIIQKKEMTEDDIKICIEKMKKIADLQSRKETLPGHGKRKRDEQYKLFWQELRTVIKASGNSPGHIELLDRIVLHQNDIKEIPVITKELSKRPKLSVKKNQNLLEIVLASQESNQRMEFSGRLLTPQGQRAKLYPNFVPKEVKRDEKVKFV